ncbi:MAG: ParB/RepB/Spo0J family partition protein [Candidatus Coprovivens sp.]
MNLESGVLQVHIEDIIPNRFQPRLTFDEQGLKELSDSIREHGIIQPLVLRKLGNKYEIIAGERRYKAAQMAGLTTVPAVISNIDDNKSAEVALVENVQRRDLTAIEEARSYKQLLDKGYLTQEQLAKRMGLSQPSIANKLRLLNLDEEVQQALLEEKISERHARTLLTLQDKNAQKEWLHRIINERLTVRQLDLELKKLKNPVSNEESSEESGIPLVKETLSAEEIRARARDLNEKEEKMSTEDIMKPQEIVENVEMLDFDETTPQIENESLEEIAPTQNIDTFIEEPIVETYTPATTVPEFNIATPNSASTLIDENNILTGNDNNKFFNFSFQEEKEDIIDPDIKETPQLEIIDNNEQQAFGEDAFIDISKEEEEKLEANKNITNIIEPSFAQENNNSYELSSNNKFFTPINESNEIELLDKKEEEVNPMDAVNKLTPEFKEQQSEEEAGSLKNAINTIRNAIKSLGNSGYYINVEEIDFPSDYQITIKINKD